MRSQASNLLMILINKNKIQYDRHVEFLGLDIRVPWHKYILAYFGAVMVVIEW